MKSFWLSKGESLVISGSSDVKHQVIVNAINYLLDNYAKTINYNNKSNLYSSVNSDFEDLIEDIKNNNVGTIIINDLNIAYNTQVLLAY